MKVIIIIIIMGAILTADRPCWATTLDLKNILSENSAPLPLDKISEQKSELIEAQKNVSRSALFPHLRASARSDRAKSLTPSQRMTAPNEMSVNFELALIDLEKIYELKQKNAELNARHTEENIEKQQNLLDLATALIDYYEANATMSVTQKNLVLLKDYEKAAQERLSLGDSTKIERDRITARRYGVEAEYLNNVGFLEEQKAKFMAISGMALEDKPEIKLLDDPVISKIAQSAIVTTNINTKMFDQKIAANELAIKSSKAAHWPSISLLADFLSSNPDNFQYNDKEKSYRVGLQINIPLFSGGETMYKTRTLVAQKNILAISRQITQDNDQQSVETLKNTLRQSLGTLEASRKSYQAHQEVYQATKREIKGGLHTTFDRLDALDEMHQSELQLIKSYANANKKLVQYLHSSGVLTPQFCRERL